jgi:2-keto-4-pentenoate hydratase/2-oxohepta-3-ene-1,7-dioic acid hydratase in catechol pathway
VYYELEIAAVIGRAARRIPLAEAEDYIAGYASTRHLRAPLTIAPGRKTRRWTILDGSTASGATLLLAGPYLVTRDEIGDPRDPGDVAALSTAP